MQSPTATYGDTEWVGLDAVRASQSAPSGTALVADNLYVQSGRWFIRPAFQGQFSAAMGAAVVEPTPIITSTDPAVYPRIWFGSGGNLYQFIPDGAHTAATQITYGGMPSLDMDGLLIRQGAGYVYVADGVHTMMRFKTDGTGGEAVAGLVMPAAPTAVSLTHALLSDFGTGTVGYDTINTSGYSSGIDPLQAVNIPTNGTANTAAFLAVGWDSVGINDTHSGIDSFNPSDFYLRVDDIGSTLSSHAAIPNLIKSSSAGHGTGAVARYATDVLVRFRYKADFAADAVTFTVTAYSDSGATVVLGSLSQTVTTNIYGFGSAGPVSPHTLIFSFASLLGDTPILSWRVTIGPGGNNKSGNNGPYVSYITAIPYCPPPVLATAPGGKAVSVAAAGDLSSTMYIGGQHLTMDLGSTKDWRGYQRLSIRFELLQTFALPPLLYLGFRPSSGGATTRADASGELVTVGGKSYATWDISNVDATVLQSVRIVEIAIGDDLALPAGDQYDGSNMVTIGELINAGNLSTGTTYQYRLVEWNAAADPTALINVIQSDGSAFSTAVTATEADAMAMVTLPAKTNTSSDYWALYRFGDDSDGAGRLLALIAWATTTIAVGGDTGKGSPIVIVPANPYISLSSGVLTDNTPASWVINAGTYEPSREAPPSGVREIAFWGGRMWVIAGAGTELWGSWLLDVDQSAGLYFSSSVGSDDPSGAIKGFFTPVGTRDNDVALRLLPVADRVIVLMRRKPPFVLLGDDARSYSLADFPLGGSHSVGLVARRAACVTGTALNVRSVYIAPAASVVWLTPNGLVAWDGSREPRNLSRNIQDLISPQLSGLPAFLPSAVAQAAVWQHGVHTYLSMPASVSDTAPTAVYRYEEASAATGQDGGQANGVWSRWTTQVNVGGTQSAIAATSGLMIPNASDNNGHWIGCRNGQLYQLVPSVGDKFRSGDSEVAIPFTFQTRAYGYESIMAVKTPARLDVVMEYENGEPDMTLTLGVIGRQNCSWSQSYALQESGDFSAAGNNVDHVSLTPGYARGELLTVALSGSTTRPWILGAIMLTAAIGSMRRR